MMITDRQFFCDALRTDIPELVAAKEAYLAGDSAGAAKKFADYVRATVDFEKFKTIDFVRRAIGTPNPEKIIPAANRVVDGWVSSCGFPHQFKDGKVDWTINPTPNQYGEWSWQFNRFEMTGTLADAYLISGDSRYAERFAYLIDSWIDQQPFPLIKIEQGAYSQEHVGWRSLEAGIRMQMPWQYPIHAFLRDEALSDAFIVKLFQSVWEHGFYLHNYNSSHNWLISEMKGLLMLATFYPFFRYAGSWRGYAFRMLESQLDVQLYPEGMQYELTTGYHTIVANDYRSILELCAAYDITVPATMKEKIHSMYTALMKIMQPDTCVPDLNDGMSRSIMGELRLALPFFPEDEAMRYFVTEGKEGAAPSYTSIALDTVGYSVMRTGWEREKDIWAFFESAHYGWGHQHEDKLAFNLFAYGKQLLSDSGNYAYDSSKMRSYIVNTAAHNTALVDGKGQRRSATYSRVMGEERYVKERIPSDLTYHYGGDAYECAEGSYVHGYGAADALLMVDHHRKVIFFKKGLDGSLPFFVLIDRFVPKDGATHQYSVNFQLDVQPIETAAQAVTARHEDGVSLSLISSAPVDVAIGQYEPEYRGWRKLSAPGTEHEHLKAPSVRFEQTAAAGHIVTVVYPNHRADMPIAAVSASAAADRSFTLTMKDGSTHTFHEDADEFATFNSKGERYMG